MYKNVQFEHISLNIHIYIHMGTVWALYKYVHTFARYIYMTNKQILTYFSQNLNNLSSAFLPNINHHFRSDLFNV